MVFCLGFLGLKGLEGLGFRAPYTLCGGTWGGLMRRVIKKCYHGYSLMLGIQNPTYEYPWTK